ncbi:MAG TPA: hypothetical protein VGF28_16915 [Thermoanaerobaculia bacterium]|jgi:hypothetical protein
MRKTIFVLAAALLLLVIVAGTSARCYWQRDWEREEEFTRALRCHMSAEEVQRLAHRLGPVNLIKPGLAGEPGIPAYAILEDDRIISLWFDQQGLVAYASILKEPYSSAPDELPIVHLCPGIIVPPPFGPGGGGT